MRTLTNSMQILREIPEEHGIIADYYPISEIVTFDFSSQKWGLIILNFSSGNFEGLLKNTQVLRDCNFNGLLIGLINSEGDIFEQFQAKFIRIGGLYLLRSRGSAEHLRECILSACRLGTHQTQVTTTGALSWSSKEYSCVIDMNRHLFSINHQEVDLTLIQRRILFALMSRPERVLSREQIITTCFANENIDHRTVDVHIGRLKQKIGAVAQHLKTVRFVGYKWSA